MAMEHILVDGYNMIHQWTEFQAIRSKNLAASRKALIHLLTRFHDCHGGKLTVVFDGRNLPKGSDEIRTDIGVIYSKQGQSADAVIERIVGQSANPSVYLVATDDHAEQNLVESLGGRTMSADVFHSIICEKLDGMQDLLDNLTSHNQRFKSR